MDIFGVGPLEFLLIVLLALIILGPRELKKTGVNLGRELNKLVRSDTWRAVQQATNRMKNLPNELMREAGLEDLNNPTPPGIQRPLARIDPRPAGKGSTPDEKPADGEKG
jgi:Sec-independent protein translocase protein TatA